MDADDAAKKAEALRARLRAQPSPVPTHLDAWRDRAAGSARRVTLGNQQMDAEEATELGTRAARRQTQTPTDPSRARQYLLE